MQSIKICPLCNGFSDLVRKSKTIVKGETQYTTYVECKVCRCRGPRCLFSEYESPSAARQEAIRLWNRREGKDDE